MLDDSPSEPVDNSAKIPSSDPSPQGTSHDDFYLDWAERYLIAGLYCWLFVRMLHRYWDDNDARVLFLLPSEGLVVFFILIRHSSRIVARKPLVWLLAFGASCVPLLAAPADHPSLVPIAVGGVVLIMGVVLQIHAKIILGRSFGCVPAHRGLKFSGPYRFVRHPMYAGYLLSHLAFIALNPSRWNLGVYCLSIGLTYPRLLMEERLLGEDPLYREYLLEVPFRLVPGLF